MIDVADLDCIYLSYDEPKKEEAENVNSSKEEVEEEKITNILFCQE